MHGLLQPLHFNILPQRATTNVFFVLCRLDRIGFTKYVHLFEQAEVDSIVLPYLTESDLQVQSTGVEYCATPQPECCPLGRSAVV